jgi:hypothetical protein
MTELSESERRLLAREVAADGYEPTVFDAADIQQVPREAFVAGWDAAVEYQQTTDGANDNGDSHSLVAVLSRPTRWRDFVKELRVEKF